jgi:hypothetical protein
MSDIPSSSSAAAAAAAVAEAAVTSSVDADIKSTGTGKVILGRPLTTDSRYSPYQSSSSSSSQVTATRKPAFKTPGLLAEIESGGLTCQLRKYPDGDKILVRGSQNKLNNMKSIQKKCTAEWSNLDSGYVVDLKHMPELEAYLASLAPSMAAEEAAPDDTDFKVGIKKLREQITAAVDERIRKCEATNEPTLTLVAYLKHHTPKYINTLLVPIAEFDPTMASFVFKEAKRLVPALTAWAFDREKIAKYLSDYQLKMSKLKEVKPMAPGPGKVALGEEIDALKLANDTTVEEVLATPPFIQPGQKEPPKL